jgi:hypothetical protein
MGGPSPASLCGGGFLSAQPLRFTVFSDDKMRLRDKGSRVEAFDRMLDIAGE